jgi:hypothetical protein
MNRLVAAALAASLIFPATFFAQERIDAEMITKIRAEGFDRSKVIETFNYLTTNIGPRLTASPAYKRAVDYSETRLKQWALDNVHLEPWQFGRGWELERLSLEMVEPRYMPLIGYPAGWSPSTKGKLSGQPIFLGRATAEELRAYTGRLQGAIVMSQPIQENPIRADRPAASGDLRNPAPARPAQAQAPRVTAQELIAFLQKEKAGLVLQTNAGEHGTVFVTGRDGGADALPTVVLASEHYNLIARMIEAGMPVKLSAEVQGRYYEQDKNAYNVIAEIKGTDPRIGDEVVMAGAHLDSWHTATGATDNADGSAVVMEALRILKTIGARPRRTIRIALWGGEEQGLLGSRAYVQRHLAGDANKAEHDKFSVYFNLDNGFVPIYGFYLQGNPEMQPIMEAWLRPFNDIGASIATQTSIGATDHLSFHNAGLPGFQAVHDYTGYDVRTHHTNMDTVERLSLESLKQASVVMAGVLYHAAMRDAKIPRPAPAK